MNNTKKLFSMIAGLALVFGFAACSNPAGLSYGKGPAAEDSGPPPGGESQPTTYAIHYERPLRDYLHTMITERAAEGELVVFYTAPELHSVMMRKESGVTTEIFPVSPGEFTFPMPGENVYLNQVKHEVFAHINNIPVFPAGNNVAYIVPETAYSPGLDWTQIEGISFRHENVYGPSYNAFVMPGEMIIVFTGPDNPPQEIKLFRIPYEGGILDYRLGMTLYSHP
jgi:hypothetical protein